ncbi:efflux transporter outer membrane subunit [Flavisphingomonas formosensis]|uniref:efflux transporter outer membrane subunit n=1 Tax=Flavisphingomonas formosensis TaxID=861534 RepID=UPI0012F74D6A|nr:efflux transporter outer membrane subunit [Sphingomonas formosensis]
MAHLRSAIFYASAVALLPCGCAPPPRPARLPLQLPATFPAQSDDPAGSSAAGEGWRSVFGGGELQTLIEQALANNRDLRIAASRIEQAHAALRAEQADSLPQLGGTIEMTKLGVPDDFALLLRKHMITNYDALLQASWEIDLFGRLRSLRAAALEQYLAAAETRRAVATSLVAQLAEAYLADRAYAERLTIARDALANRTLSLRLMVRRYETGSGSKLEVTQAETLRDQAAAEIQTIELARAQTLNAMALLVGEPMPIARFAGSLADVGLNRPIPAGLPSELLVHRPDILAAEHELRRAEADIGAARAAFFPSISLTGAAGSTSQALDSLFTGGTGLWLFRPTITLPIFTGGKLRANLRGSEALRDEMLSTYEKAIQAAFRDVADALAARHWLGDRIATAEQSLAALRERSRLARLRYEAGRSAYLEILDAERDRFTAEQNLVELRRAWLASGVALYAALGGGFPEPEDQGRR